ncbi:MAG: hypothetical protein GF341_00265 [candidate division Zixibacteria bacterium]|nr:hypothetical protein [candidate division Zixibacteria bacterium]
MKSVLVIVLVAAVMAGAAFFTVRQVVLPQFGPGSQAASADASETTAAQKGEGEVYLIEDLLINPKGTEGTRYLSTSLGLEVASPEAVEKLQERDLQVRDMLISILSSRTVTQLTSTTERERMRLEIQERLDNMLKGQQLLAVYFVDYVMQ